MGWLIIAVCTTLALLFIAGLAVRRLLMDVRALRKTITTLVRGAFTVLMAENPGDLAERLRWLRRELLWCEHDHPVLADILRKATGRGLFEHRRCIACDGVIQPYGGVLARHQPGVPVWTHEACTALPLVERWSRTHMAENPGHVVRTTDEQAHCETCSCAVVLGERA